MSAVVEDVVIPVRSRAKKKSFLEMLNLKTKVDDWKFAKIWADRNIENGELLVDTLEIDPIIMDQYMFIEENKQLLDKLERIGFKELTKYPNQEQFSDFSYIMFNDKYNVAISVYKPNMKKTLETANSIAEETEFSLEYKLAVFLSAVKILNK